MKLTDVMQQKLIDHQLGYWNLMRWLTWTVFAMLTKPGAFEYEGQRVENVLANGTLRILIGGFFTIAVGLMLITLGTLSSLFIASAWLLMPLWAAGLLAWARVKHRKLHRLMAAMVASAKEARRHE